MATPAPQGAPQGGNRGAALAERIGRDLSRVMFAARWVVAPIYLGLLAALVIVVFKFGQKLFHTFVLALTEEGSNGTLISVLSLIDLALIGNLVVMVMLAGWESFVVRFDIANRPEWMVGVDYSALKLKLVGSVTVIAAVDTLEVLIGERDLPTQDVAWQLLTLLALGIAGVLLALMDRLSGKH